MYDNKVRLSKDVIDKAELIAAEWGLKNARAAIEAVFRKYADDYRYGRSVPVQQAIGGQQSVISPGMVSYASADKDFIAPSVEWKACTNVTTGLGDK